MSESDQIEIDYMKVSFLGDALSAIYRIQFRFWLVSCSRQDILVALSYEREGMLNVRCEYLPKGEIIERSSF